MNLFINARFLTQRITGVQQFAIEISRHLKDSDINCTFLCPPAAAANPLFKELQCKIVGKSTGYVWEQTELPLYLLGKGKPLLLNLCNTAPMVYPKQIVTLHDISVFKGPQWYNPVFARLYRFMMPRIARNALHVLTVSNTVKKEIAAAFKVNDKRITVLYNGLNRDLLKVPSVEAKREKTILTVGSLNPRKNLVSLVKAFSASGLAEDNYELLIIGEKKKVFAEQAFAPHDVKNVRFSGYLSNEQLADAYRRAMLFVSLSHDEGFGIPVLEALHFGCPVLLSDIPVYRELFEDSAHFVPAADAVQTASAMKELLVNRPAKPARSAVPERYNYSLSTNTLINLLLSIDAK